MIGPLVLLLRLLVLAALYGFLGFALWVVWKELSQADSRGGKDRVPTLRLEVKAKAARSVRYVFEQPEVIIGRNPLADIALDDKAVSARHARFSFHDAQWWIDDLDSTNGTRLNRERVRGPTVLTNGDEVKCGGLILIVRLAADLGAAGPRRGGQDE